MMREVILYPGILKGLNLVTYQAERTEGFHRPQYIIPNLAIGGDGTGNPDATASFPDTVSVDYVRVYQSTSN